LPAASVCPLADCYNGGMTAGEAGDATGGIVPVGERLARAALCVLMEGGPDPGGFEARVAELFAAGVPMLQLRDKRLSDDALLARLRAALAAARTHCPLAPPLVIVNDRVAVAAAAGADGVHVGAADMPVTDARRLLGSAAVIGRTAHDLAEAEAAVAAGADYLGVGPCYPSATKSFASHAPRPFLAAAGRLPLPVFAIGGVTVERLGELAGLGIRRVAVAAAVTAAADPAAAVRALLAATGTR
jgi:thiamine-phosphate pyrophosphorylase